MLEYNSRCQPPWGESQLRHKLLCAYQRTGPLPEFTSANFKLHNKVAAIIPASSRWPAVNQELREAIIADEDGLHDLWEAAPVRFDDNEQHSEQIIDRLFPDNPLLCCGKSKYDFNTKSRDDWRGELSGLQFIVPSPMSAVAGLTQDGKESKHTLSNTGARRFLVVEFDTGMLDEHAALLIHLTNYMPLACVVYSGGKSLHGWFYVHGQPSVMVGKFFQYAVSLGADKATWTRSQFARMPDGRRDNGQLQTVYFFNNKIR